MLSLPQQPYYSCQLVSETPRRPKGPPLRDCPKKHFYLSNATQASDRKDLVPGPRDFSWCFRQNLRLVVSMERASGRNENHHDGRSDYRPGPRTRMHNHYRETKQSEKRERWEDNEQALIITIRKETKRTEELEQAEHRSPRWAVVRALQQINSATNSKRCSDLSTTPFFQLVGREDLLFWG